MLNIEWLRYIAMFTMLIDHIGIVYDIDIFRNIGRLAFPIFSYIFIRNLIEGGEELENKYAKRLLIFGLFRIFIKC